MVIENIGLNALPHELIIDIGKRLDLTSARSFAGTCQQYRKLMRFSEDFFAKLPDQLVCTIGEKLKQPDYKAHVKFAATGKRHLALNPPPAINTRRRWLLEFSDVPAAVERAIAGGVSPKNIWELSVRLFVSRAPPDDLGLRKICDNRWAGEVKVKNLRQLVAKEYGLRFSRSLT